MDERSLFREDLCLLAAALVTGADSYHDLQVWGTQYLTSVYTSHWSLGHGAPLSLYYLRGL